MAYKKKWYDDYSVLQLMYIKKGQTIDEIAATLNVSNETVRRLLIKHDLKRGK
jgi:orotate phosphoribosyltransferase-like protein